MITATSEEDFLVLGMRQCNDAPDLFIVDLAPILQGGFSHYIDRAHWFHGRG